LAGSQKIGVSIKLSRESLLHLPGLPVEGHY
jgi:hypothetical protein